MVETGASMLKDDLGPAYKGVFAHWEADEKRTLIVEHSDTCPKSIKRRHALFKKQRNNPRLE